MLFESEQVLASAKDLQSATRGFVITGDSSFISVVSRDAYILDNVKRLQQLTADNRTQELNIERLLSLVKKRIELSRRTVSESELRENLERARDITLKGEEVMIRIRDLIDKIQAEEQRLLQLRNEANSNSAATLNTIFFVLLICCGLIVGLVFLFIRRYLSYKRKVETHIRDFNVVLEKRVEEKTQSIIEQEHRFHFVLDHMFEGVQIIGFDKQYIYVNQAFLKQSMQASEALLGNKIYDQFPQIEHTDFYKALDECMNRRRPQRLETEISYLNGASWYDISIQPTPEGVFILSMDISERKNREIAQKRYLRETEEVLFKISHEVRRPVVQILGVTNLFETSRVGSQDTPMLMGALQKSARELDTYTRDLSTFVTRIKDRNVR